MVVMGVDDFLIMDIFKFESKWIIIYLSVIINLFKFKWVFFFYICFGGSGFLV